MRSMGLGVVVCVVLGTLVVGCSAGRDAEVTGEVAAPSSVTLSGPIKLEFIDVVDDADEAENEVVHSVELNGPGAFAETVSVQGSKLLVLAINDRDGDGACSAGEAWGEAEAEIGDDDSVSPVTLTLGAAGCP
jgi:hypothetical protein